jgi:hypothetical protein
MKNLQSELKKGRTFSQYNNIAGLNKMSNSRFMWDDTKEVINSKSVIALKRAGLLEEKISIKNA